jgi:hypothetical protein
VENSNEGASTIYLRNIGSEWNGEVKCVLSNRVNKRIYSVSYTNLICLQKLNECTKCNSSYFGLLSEAVNSVIEDQTVYITKKPDDIKTTVGETICIEV